MWLAVAAVLVLAVPAAAYFAQESLLFLPQFAGPPAPLAQVARRVEPLTFGVAPGVDVRGWLVHGTGERAPLLIYYGGNADEASWQALAPWPRAWALALVNYRGYGTSGGRPGERELYADALHVFDALARRADIDATRVVLVGRSLGSGVATYVAAHRSVAGVVLVSPYDSMTALGRRHYPLLPVGLLLKHRFDSLSRADGIHAPLLAVVGRRDSVIPPEHSQRLFDAWAGAKTWIEIADGDHDSLAAGPAFWSAIERFLAGIE